MYNGSSFLQWRKIHQLLLSNACGDKFVDPQVEYCILITLFSSNNVCQSEDTVSEPWLHRIDHIPHSFASSPMQIKLLVYSNVIRLLQ